MVENLREDTLQGKVFAVLRDQAWHCRGHSYKDVPSGQLAGGGGIQGLQRGTKKRSGLVLVRKEDICSVCGKRTVWDRWTGELQQSNAPAGISKALMERIFSYYGYTDVIEQRQRPSHELVADHRVPMERWGETEKLSTHITDAEVQQKFQVLKKDMSGNHNLLKSRACEACIRTGKRGFPLGIEFYYHGNAQWPDNFPQKGPGSERGCFGCGWYDFARWRNDLNVTLSLLT
jgi:hypothetical protein